MTTSPADSPVSAAPGSTSSLRAANQRRVLAVLQSHVAAGAVTQAHLARTTQLAPATVSNIVRELSAAGVVETVPGSGRRGTAVRISRSAGLIAGVDIGHRHIRVAVGDLSGQVITESRRAIEPTHPHEEALELVRVMLDELLGAVPASYDAVISVGMGLPAPIGADGLVTAHSILPGWMGVDAAKVTSAALAKPVHIDNDANLGALAEHRRGAGVGHDCMVYIKVSSGVGGGLIIGGQLFRGGAGTAGEVGHLTIDENGPLCRCGSRGCLEAYCSVGTVVSQLAEQHPGATFTELVAAAHAGDAGALRVIEDAGRHLGWGVAMLANLINPTLVVVGGDMAHADLLLLEAIGAGTRRHALGNVGADLTLAIAALGDRSSVVGALLLAQDRARLSLPS